MLVRARARTHTHTQSTYNADVQEGQELQGGPLVHIRALALALTRLSRCLACMIHLPPIHSLLFIFTHTHTHTHTSYM